MLKAIKHPALVIFAILGIILFAIVVKAVNDSYRINKTTSSIINEQGSCKSVTNNSATNDYFIPTKTLTEWNLFKQNKPADVSLNSCYQCPENEQIYSDSSSCASACTQTANCTQTQTGCSATFTYNNSLAYQGDDCSECRSSLGSCGLGDGCISGRCEGTGNPNQCSPSGCYYIGQKRVTVGSYTEWNYCTDSGTETVYQRNIYNVYECATININYSYSCPLSGGSTCSGPGTCTAGQSCTTLP